jgi:hypothetical protein
MKTPCRLWALVIVAIALGVLIWTTDPFHDWYRPGFHDPDPAVRAQAIRRLPYDSRDPVLAEMLHDENADVAMLAAMHMQSWTDGRPLIPALKDNRVGVRKEAAKALAATADWRTLNDALHSDDPELRKGAILALRYTGLFIKSYWGKETKPPEVGPILQNLANSDPDPSVRLAAEQELKR